MPLAIDTHAHVFHRALKFDAGRRYSPDYDALPQTYLALLDRHAIAHGVLTAVSILGTDNEYLLQSVAASAGRLRGIVCLNPVTDLGQIAVLAQRGICGLRINLDGLEAPALETRVWRTFLEACRRQHWLIEVNDHAARLHRTVEPLLAAGLRVVLDHFGRPDPLRGVLDPGFRYVLQLAASRQVWVKLSGAYRVGWAQAADAAALLRQAYGAERLLWGSDWPFTGFEQTGVDFSRTLATLKAWLPDDDERLQVLGATPARLFGFAEIAA
jgi:predicted TIM-barrel fold metal-dependent hydrolase